MLSTPHKGDGGATNQDRLDSLSAAAGNRSIEGSLQAIRQLLGLEVVYATEFCGDRQVFRWTEGDGESFGVLAGIQMPLSETYCKRVLAGELPAVMPDVAAHPAAGAMRITASAAVGSFISVPLWRSDGALYGTLCAASHAPHPDLTERDVQFLQVFARLICDEIERLDREPARRRLEIAAASMEALLAAVDARDAYTGEHTRVVVDLARRVGVRYGLSDGTLEDLAHVALLHDLGKLGIPDAVLLKTGSLDAEEWRIMRNHSAIGAAILASVPVLEHLAPAVRAEHERWDGTGYPDGLREDDIPVASRIVLVCDAYHAMTSDRPYRAACTPDVAIAELRRHAGGQFDPRAVAALVAVLVDGD